MEAAKSLVEIDDIIQDCQRLIAEKCQQIESLQERGASTSDADTVLFGCQEILRLLQNAEKEMWR